MLTLSTTPGLYAICRLEADAPIPAWAHDHDFFTITRTLDELSVVCPQASVPAGIRMESGWRILMVQGPLDFNAVGHLASLSAPLARAGISVFAVSTFDTDYLLVKEKALDVAVTVLAQHGHRVC